MESQHDKQEKTDYKPTADVAKVESQHPAQPSAAPTPTPPAAATPQPHQNSLRSIKAENSAKITRNIL